MASTTKARKAKYTKATSGEDYLSQRIAKLGGNFCWEWLKGKDKNGYGQCHDAKFAKQYKVTRAHQLAFVVWKGPIPPNKIICHTCDNPSCVNPQHLYAGTWKDNVHDCIKRGRYINGMKNNNKNYASILAEHGKLSCFQAADKYNLSCSRICQIWRENGKYGKHFHKGQKI